MRSLLVGLVCYLSVVGFIYSLHEAAHSAGRTEEGSCHPLFLRAGESSHCSAAFDVDDLLIGQPDLPTCHDGDLGFGENATLRQVVSVLAQEGGRCSKAWRRVVGGRRRPPARMPPGLADQVERLRDQRFLFVALLHENARVLPFWSRELVKVIAAVANKCRDNVHVSIFESHSTDYTGQLLQSLLDLLRDLGVGGTLHTGHPVDPPQGRIAFLAHLRNLALVHLFHAAAVGEPFTHVVYLNDVFFCGRGVLELLAHMGARGRAGGWSFETDMACAVDYVTAELDVYDKWAAHDISGRMFLNHKPYVAHAPSAEALRDQRPFQVLSCWNGLAVIRADAFTDKGLRFRRNRPLECAASECDLLCRDLWAVGMHRILMVPRVKVAYGLKEFALLRRLVSGPGGDRLRWSTAQPDPFPFTKEPPRHVTCCPISSAVDAHFVDHRGCYQDPFWAHLYPLLGAPRAAAPTELSVKADMADAFSSGDAGVKALLEEVRRRRLGAHTEARTPLLSESAALSRTACERPSPLRIPRRVIHVLPTTRIDRLPRATVMNILGWSWAHPCYEADVVTAEEATRAAASLAHVRDALGRAPTAEERMDLVRYAYLHLRGGILVGEALAPTRSLDTVLREQDELVVAMEADFRSLAAAERFGYLDRRTLSTDFVAAVPSHPALDRLVWKVVGTFQGGAGGRPHVSVGPVSAAERSVRSGAAAMSQVLLAEDGVRVLSPHALGRSVGGDTEGEEAFFADQGAAGGDAAGRPAPVAVRVGSLPWRRPELGRAVFTARQRWLESTDGHGGLAGGEYLRAFEGSIVDPATGAAVSMATVESLNQSTALAAVWSFADHWTPAERLRVRQHTAAGWASAGTDDAIPRSYAMLHHNGSLGVYAGSSPSDKASRLLYAWEPTERLRWPFRPMLLLRSGGELALERQELCDGPCKGVSGTLTGLPPEVQGAADLWSLRIAPAGTPDSSHPPAPTRSRCASYVLFLRAWDAAVTVACATPAQSPSSSVGRDQDGLVAARAGLEPGAVRGPFNISGDLSPPPSSRSGAVSLHITRRGQLCTVAGVNASAAGRGTLACWPAVAATDSGNFHAEVAHDGRVCVLVEAPTGDLQRWWCSPSPEPSEPTVGKGLLAIGDDGCLTSVCASRRHVLVAPGPMAETRALPAPAFLVAGSELLSPNGAHVAFVEHQRVCVAALHELAKCGLESVVGCARWCSDGSVKAVTSTGYALSAVLVVHRAHPAGPPEDGRGSEQAGGRAAPALCMHVHCPTPLSCMEEAKSAVWCSPRRRSETHGSGQAELRVTDAGCLELVTCSASSPSNSCTVEGVQWSSCRDASRAQGRSS